MQHAFQRLLLLISVLALMAIPAIAQDDSGNGSAVSREGSEITIDTEQATENFIALTNSAAEGFAASLDTILERLVTVPENDITRLVFIIGGVLLLFIGWRIYNWIIVLAGALVGAGIGVALVGNADLIIQVAALLIGGFIGALLGAFLFYFTVGIVGAYVGVQLTIGLALVLGFTPVSPWVLLAAAVIGALILLGLSLQLLIFLSASLGAQMLVLALGLSPAGVWMIALTIIGMFAQILFTRRTGRNVFRRPRRIIPWRRHQQRAD